MMTEAIRSGPPPIAVTLHLTLGTPSLLSRYEAAADEASFQRLVIDREGMAAEFLAKLAAEARFVVTIQSRLPDGRRLCLTIAETGCQRIS